VDRLQSMGVFVQVVDLGSFAAAAKTTNLSATMVAKHVAGLERRLGSRLLYRTTRRQGLTEVGKVYYDRCKALLADVEAAECSVSLLQGAPRGTLRVTAPVSFAARRLAPALAEFLRLYPDVSVDLAASDRVVDLIEEGIEAAIRVGPLADSRLVARALRPYRSLLCAAPSYLRRCGAPKSPGDLASHVCLGFSYAQRPGRWRLTRDGEERLVQYAPRLQVNNGEALRQAALAGAGIVMQPEVLLDDDVKEGRLVRLLPAWGLPEQPMHLVYARDWHMTPKLQRFIEFVLQRFAK
jgi:DNA-binding transcriptional LysR family regulator